MAASAQTPKMTADQYLAMEAASARKHEYERGEIFAMSGTSDAHNDVVMNIIARLKAHLRGGPCRAQAESVKLRVEAADAYYYPDLFVTCDPRDRLDPLIKRHAVLVIEVLSESTAEYDRNEKFAAYRLSPSLREYVLVDSRIQHVVVYRKNDAGTWEFYFSAADGEVSLASIDLKLPVAAIYDDTEIPATRPPPPDTRYSE